MPTQKPAKSNLSFAYVPGISAVSPPTRLQFDKEQPLNIPSRIFLVFVEFQFT